jgi:UDP-glucose 4-epimerase
MNDKTTVLVTGCGGFIGRRLVPYLAALGHRVIAASRTVRTFDNPDIVSVQLSDLSAPCDWQPLLRTCDAVVHLAGIVHTFADEDRYDRVNHRATAHLAEAARQRGAHLVFVSSIAAQSSSSSEHELAEDDPPQPSNPYGRSKLAAEHAVRASGVSSTILRPVVMYGEGEKGNFAFLHRISRLPVPLPFASLKAKRSVLSLENFCSAVQLTLTDPRARGETFIVSDPEPLSVSELIVRHRASLGRSPGLVPVPEKWIELSLRAMGRTALWKSLGCPLVARPMKLLALGWQPS